MTNYWIIWLRAALDDPRSPVEFRGALTMLTGQDMAVLDAIVDCWLLYAKGDEAGRVGAVQAVRALLPALQPKSRPFARELIAYALDWSDRNRLWAAVA